MVLFFMFYKIALILCTFEGKYLKVVTKIGLNDIISILFLESFPDFAHNHVIKMLIWGVTQVIPKSFLMNFFVKCYKTQLQVLLFIISYFLSTRPTI